MKFQEISRVGGIAIIRDNVCCISLPMSWNKKRVFALLKEDYDRAQRQREKRNIAQIGKFAAALISQGKQK